jgi:hypothetical protein
VRTTTRSLVLSGAALVGAATAATSSVSLYQLAELCGIPPILSAALPIALDAGAGVAALVWITEQGERRSWGRGIAVGALVASLGGNGVQHAIVSGLLPVTLPLVLVVGGCIPAMLWAVAHLAALMARDDTPAKPRVERAPRKPTTKLPATPPVVPTAPTELAGVVDLGKPTRGGSRRELIRDYMRTHPDQRPAEVIRGMAAQGIEVPMKEAAEVYRRMQQAEASA